MILKKMNFENDNFFKIVNITGNNYFIEIFIFINPRQNIIVRLCNINFIFYNPKNCKRIFDSCFPFS